MMKAHARTMARRPRSPQAKEPRIGASTRMAQHPLPPKAADTLRALHADVAHAQRAVNVYTQAILDAAGLAVTGSVAFDPATGTLSWPDPEPEA